jgi:hypothetical protein
MTDAPVVTVPSATNPPPIEVFWWAAISGTVLHPHANDSNTAQKNLILIRSMTAHRFASTRAHPDVFETHK